ncbi:MAG: ABC transporter substrate-binding protein, partial [Armatimonadetes bacterium]|nr:ABC transporter substrate-binding protein [Armatimonadota bacterium]
MRHATHVVRLAALMTAAIVGVVVLALPGPGRGQAKDTLVIALPFEIPTADTHKVTGLPAIGMNAQISDVLVLEQNGKVVPWLAESWELADGGRSLIFKIRDNVRMHDGRTLTAEDVKFSLDRFRKFSVGRSALLIVESITTMPGNRVRVTARAPYAPLLRTFTYTTISVYSKAAIESMGEDQFSRRPVGPGPYTFVELIRGDRMVLEAFDQYWAGRPRFRRIIVRTIRDDQARVAALEAGDVDVIHAFSPLEAERLAKNSRLKVLNPPSAGFIRLNMNVQRPPFNNVKVRQAMAHALNRELIAKGIFKNLARVAHSIVPDNAFGYTPRYDVYDYNPDRARQLLQEAKAENVSFILSVGAGRYLMDREVAITVQAQLRRVGVNVQLQFMEWGQFADLIRQPLDKSQTQMTLTWWRTINGDADSAIGIFSRAELPPAGNNIPFYDNAEWNRLYDAQQVERDEKKRLALLHDLQRIAMRDLPVIPMYNQPQFWATRANLSNFEPKITPLSTVHP